MSLYSSRSILNAIQSPWNGGSVITPGETFVTNLSQGTTAVTPAVDFLSNTNARSKYTGCVVADRQCELQLEHSADNVSFDMAAPRVTASRVPGDLVGVASATRSGNVVTITTATSHSFRAGQWIVVRGIGEDFDGNSQIAAVPTAVSLTFDRVGPDATAGLDANPTILGSAKFAAFASNDAMLRFARARVYNTSSLQPAAIASIVRSGNVATVATVGAHGFAAGDVVAVSGVADSSNFPTLPGGVLLTATSNAFTLHWNGADASSTGGTASPSNDTTSLCATIAARL